MSRKRRRDDLAWRTALDDHYAAAPEDRPSLAMIAVADAEQTGNPLASRPDLIERAADWVERHRPDGDFDVVLRVAESMHAAE